MSDWIKMRSNLVEDPRVMSIAEFLQIPELHAVGLLYRLWAWADQHSTDGNALSVTGKHIDRMVAVDGFASALRTVGWLDGKDMALSLPRFSEHNGQTAKQRALTSRRVTAYRRARNADTVTKSVTKSVTNSLPDKRREEKKDIPPVVPQGGTSVGEDEPIRDPPVVVPEPMARRWFEDLVNAGAGFQEADFQEAFRLLHGTRDVRMGCWKVGRSGLVSDPRTILEQRLHDAMGRRVRSPSQVNGDHATPSAGSRAFVLRQQIQVMERQVVEHKGNPDGMYDPTTKEIYEERFLVKSRELAALRNQLAAINESVAS